MENFKKITLEDFLTDFKSENKLIDLIENLSNPRYLFTEGFDFDDYYQYKINSASKEELGQLTESVSKSNIEKANFILTHSNDKLIRDIYDSKGNIKAMQYYNTIESMVNDLNLVCPHNKELMKANQIIYELVKNKQVYTHAFAKNNIYRKCVYFSSAVSAIYTIIKEHLMHTDMTSSKNEGKFVMMQHQVVDITDKDNVKNLDNNLKLIMKRGVNSESPKSFGPAKLHESSSLFDVYRYSRSSFLYESGVGFTDVPQILGDVKDGMDTLNTNMIKLGAATAAGASAYKMTNTMFAGAVEDAKGLRKSILQDTIGSEASTDPRTADLAIKYIKNKDSISADDKVYLMQKLGDEKFSQLEYRANHNTDELSRLEVADANEKLAAIPGNITKSVTDTYSTIKSSISSHWDSIAEWGMIGMATLAALYVVINFGKLTNKLIMYLDTYEYVRNVSKNGSSRSDRVVGGLLDKISGLKRFLLRIWIDNKSKNVQEYMKELGKDVEIIKKNSPEELSPDAKEVKLNIPTDLNKLNVEKNSQSSHNQQSQQLSFF